MKKQLLALAILSAGFVNAQTFTQDFSSPTPPALPAGWMQNNVDGLTVDGNLSGYSFGANAWVTKDINDGIHGKVAVSTSWYNPVGVSNDWLITPSFTVPAGTVYLDWEAIAPDPAYRDGYQVMLSTTGTLVGAFTTTLFTVGQEAASWTQHVINMAAYAGQTVNLAWRNNSNDMYLLFVDNIKIISPPPSDGAVVSLNNLTRYMAGAGNQTISGTFKSLGAITATSAVLNYKVNAGATVTQTLAMPSLTYGASAPYTFSTAANIPLGTDKIKVWVTAVNGVAETNFTNDTASAFSYVASQTTVRNALIEEWTSSTCNPCAALNATYDPLLQGNLPNTAGRVNVIKYQVNWPSPGNDPSYNPHSAARVSYYGINAAPSTKGNGVTDFAVHNQAEIDAAKAVPAFANITCNIMVAGAAVTANATVTPFVGIPANSPLRVHQVLLQDFYNYQAGTTTQKNYYHVMRKMFPDATGAPFIPVDGVAQTINFNHTITTAVTPAQGSYDFWSGTFIRYEYVVFVQDQISNDILQSGSNFFQTPNGVVEFKNENKIGVYPNPAKDYAVVGIILDKPTSVDINIYDVTGKLVYNNKAAEVHDGTSEIRINTSEFASGTYNVVVNTGDVVLKDKLIIVK